MESNITTKPTTFFIVRHGETEWNTKGLLQGHMDSPLSKLGLNQANALADHFSKCEWNAIICSDLGRAVMTASIICNNSDKKLISDKRLRERNLGIAQGLTLKDFGNRFPDEFAKFNEGEIDYIIPDGESISQRYQRSISCLQEYSERFAGQKIIVVTHGGILDGIFRHITKIPLGQPRTFSLFNASVNTIEVKGLNWSIVTWGYVEHLRSLGSLDDWYRGAI